MADVSGSGDDLASISIKFTSSDKAAGHVAISLEKTVGDLKQIITSQFSVEPKRLIFQGRILNKDGQTLTECKLKDGLTVVVQTVPAGKAPTPASPPPTPAVPSTPAPSSNLAGQPSAAAFAGLPPLGGPAASTPIGLAVATVKGQPAGVARECLTTLVKIIDNIVQHPLEEKYRKIKRANAGFRRKVGRVPGGEACMTALGFTETDTGESWLLNPTAAAWEVLTVGRVQIQTGLATLPISGGAARNNTATAGVGSPAGFAAGLGELPVPGTYPGGFQGGGMGMGAGAGPDMAAIHRMAQDPAMMRTMMSDPTVQGMMRNNPQMGAAMQAVASNPALMNQAFSMMQNNPAMMQQAQRMLQDPAALQRASQMDLGGAFGAGLNAAQGFPQPTPGVGGNGGIFPNPTPATTPVTAPAPATAPSTTPQAPAVAPSPAGDGEASEEKSEDDLMAEAIRRSLEDS